MSLCSATDSNVPTSKAKDGTIEGLRGLLRYADKHQLPIFGMTLAKGNTTIYSFEINGVIPPYYIARNNRKFPGGEEVFIADSSELYQLFIRIGHLEQVYRIDWSDITSMAFVCA